MFLLMRADSSLRVPPGVPGPRGRYFLVSWGLCDGGCSEVMMGAVKEKQKHTCNLTHMFKGGLEAMGTQRKEASACGAQDGGGTPSAGCTSAFAFAEVAQQAYRQACCKE